MYFKRAPKGRGRRSEPGKGDIIDIFLMNRISVFLNRQGRHYSQSYLNDVWNKAVKAAGYPPISLYNASRHSLGTKLADEGESPEMIAEVLGHTDTKSTKKYARYGTRALKPFFKRRTIAKSKIVTKSLPMKK